MTLKSLIYRKSCGFTNYSWGLAPALGLFSRVHPFVFVSHVSDSRSPDSPYGLDSLLIRILYLLILLTLCIREIQDGGNENNKTKIITEFSKSSWIIFTNILIIAKINYHCNQMISKTVCHNQSLSGWILLRARFNRSLVLSRIPQALSRGWATTWIWIPKFPFVFALGNITRSWSAILNSIKFNFYFHTSMSNNKLYV